MSEITITQKTPLDPNNITDLANAGRARQFTKRPPKVGNEASINRYGLSKGEKAKVLLGVASLAAVAGGAMVIGGGDPSSPTFKLPKHEVSASKEGRPSTMEELTHSISVENNGLVLKEGAKLLPLEAALKGASQDQKPAHIMEFSALDVQPLSVPGGYLVQLPGAESYLTPDGKLDEKSFGYIPDENAETLFVENLDPVGSLDTIDMTAGQITVSPVNGGDSRSVAVFRPLPGKQ